MKEIISAVFLILGTWGIGYETKHFYDLIRTAALEKAAQGLPSLSDFNRHLHERKPVQRKPRGGHHA